LVNQKVLLVGRILLVLNEGLRLLRFKKPGMKSLANM
jgi:hypothetical protein